MNPALMTGPERVMSMLRQALDLSGIPIKHLAIRTGLSASCIQRIAAGGTKWPRPETLVSLCQVLDLELTLQHRGTRSARIQSVVQTGVYHAR